MRGKKAEISGEVLYFIPRIIFLAAVLFAVVILVKSYILTTIDIRPVEAGILANRIILANNGISYTDAATGRNYPGIVDMAKFKALKNSPNFLDTDSMAYADNGIIAARMTIKANGIEETGYYNKERFDKWYPRAIPGIKGGAGSVASFEKKAYVIVKDGQKMYPAMLEFYIIS